MPTVPTSDSLGAVGVGTLPATQASPASFGAQVGAATQGLGQSIDQASNVANQIGLQLQNQQNLTDFNNRFHTLQNFIQTKNFGDPSDPTAAPGFYGMRGQNAVDAYKPTVDAINQQQEALTNGLPPNMQAEFQRASRGLVDHELQGMGLHATQQAQTAQTDSDNAVISGDHERAAAYFNDPKEINNSLVDSQNTVIRMGQRNGLSSDAINEQVADNKSKLLTSVIDRMSQQNPLAAWQFYQQHAPDIGGLYQSAIEQHLKPQIDVWKSRIDADSIISGDTGRTAAGVASEATAQGVDPVLALTSAKIESGLGTHLQSSSSSANGVFQLTDGTWAANGGTAANRADPATQIKLGVQNLATSQQTAQTALGRAPEPWETYLVHQQGAAGGPALLKADPGANAVSVLTPIYGDANKARLAIVNNGGTPDMSAGQFLGAWQQRFNGVASTVSVPPPVTPGSTIAPPGVPTSTDPRDHVADWLAQANGTSDFRGVQDPNYQAMVADRIKQKVGEIEYGQAQAQRAVKSTLLSAALGVPDPATLPAGGTSTPPTPAPPMSLEDMFTASPAAKTAFLSADPETQRSIMEMLHTNATQGPPVTEAATDKYYALRGQAISAPADFLNVNLADHDLVSTMPHQYLHELMGLQMSIDKNAASNAQRTISLTHAREVVAPDLLAAGLNPRPQPGTPAADAAAQFDGRLDDALQKFQVQNNRRPSDAEIKGLGATLLTPGYIRGTGSLWGLLPNDTPSRLYAAQAAGNDAKFYPQVPQSDRQGIVAAYGAKHGGAQPTEGQVQSYWMASRSMRPAQPASTIPRLGGGSSLPPAQVDEGSGPLNSNAQPGAATLATAASSVGR